MASKIWVISLIIVLTVTCTLTFALPIEVGTGSNSADVYIEWSDGYISEFVVNFGTETVSGLGVFDIIEAETTLTTVRDNFGWGVFIDGISYQGHSDIGYDGGENWWHFWIKDPPGQQWTSPAYGVADRVLYNGYSDGWVYSHAGAPIPEPTTIAMFGVAALLLRKKKIC